MVLRAKPPKPLEKCIHYTCSIILPCVTVILSRPITKSCSVSIWLGQHDQLLHIYTCLLISSSTNRLQSVFSAILIQTSQLSVNMSSFYSTLWVSVISMLYTCTPTQPNCTHTHPIVSLQTQPKQIIF